MEAAARHDAHDHVRHGDGASGGGSARRQRDIHCGRGHKPADAKRVRGGRTRTRRRARRAKGTHARDDHRDPRKGEQHEEYAYGWALARELQRVQLEAREQQACRHIGLGAAVLQHVVSVDFAARERPTPRVNGSRKNPLRSSYGCAVSRGHRTGGFHLGVISKTKYSFEAVQNFASFELRGSSRR